MQQRTRQPQRQTVLAVLRALNSHTQTIFLSLRAHDSNIQHAARLIPAPHRIQHIDQHAKRLHPRRRKCMRPQRMAERVIQSPQYQFTTGKQRQSLRIFP